MLYFLPFLSFIYPAFASLSGLVKRQHLSFPIRVFWFQCILATIIEVVSISINLLVKEPTQWLFNCFMLAEFWFLITIARGYLEKLNTVFSFLGIAVTFVWLFLIWLNGISALFYYLFAVLSVLYIAMYAAVLYKNSKQDVPFLQIPETWMCFSVILFFAGSLPVMTMMRISLAKNQIVSKNIYVVISFLNIARYILASFTFLKSEKKYQRQTTVM